MRILFLSQLIPYPLDAGPKVRSYYVLRHLAAAGHRVTLMAFLRETDAAASLDHLRQYCNAIHTVPMVRSRGRDLYHLGRSFLTDEPFLIARDRVNAMTEMVRRMAGGGGYDVVHADQLWMAPYALSAAEAAVEAGHARPRLVLDQHNAMYLIPQRLAEHTRNPIQRRLLRREAAVMRRYELETCARFDEVVWVTAEDRAAVGLDGVPGRRGAITRQHVIPICVDPMVQTVIERIAAPYRVTFLGGLHWPPNAAGIRWFAREIWPRVAAACPEAVLTIIGKSPPDELRVAMRSESSRIICTGYVDDPRPYLAESAVFIVPLLAGGGMRVKILDAWCWGLPLVSTTIGAEGIGYLDGVELLIADTAEAFAAAVIRVFGDRDYAERIAAAGREAVETAYGWEVIYDQWNAVYREPVAVAGVGP